jgi:hypothetical protein
MARGLGLLALVLGACAEPASGPQEDEFARLVAQEGAPIDTLGVVNLAQGDTLSNHPGLVIVDRQLTFPPEAESGEVFAWEFYATQLNPIKLIIVRFDDSGEYLELVGESEMVVPARRGSNRYVLREPIPIHFGCMMGIVQPEEATIPFRKVFNYKTLIAARPLERPLMRRDLFAMYGWRYSLRVFWRKEKKEDA